MNCIFFTWGNHHVSGIPGEELHGVLEVRELQYRSYEHFLVKIEKARTLFASWDVPREHGSHMRALTEMNEAQLATEWDKLRSMLSKNDPIDYRGVA